MQANQLSLSERCTVLAALRRSLRYLHYHMLRAERNQMDYCRSYWMGEIREAYGLYRRTSFGSVCTEDRYFKLVDFVTNERV